MNSIVHPLSCFDPARGLTQLADKSVNHVITDPPYEEFVHAPGNRRSYNGGVIVKPAMPFAAITEAERFACAHEFVRLSRGWILVFSALEGVAAWQKLLLAAGARRRTTMVWVKPNVAPKFSGDGPAAAAEAIVAVWAGQERSIWNCRGMAGVYRDAAERRYRRHSTQKPASLMRQLIADFTQPGELILDPFAGGGSTLLAAAELGRAGLGYEIDPEVAALAQLTIDHARPHSVLPRASKTPFVTKPRSGCLRE